MTIAHSDGANAQSISTRRRFELGPTHEILPAAHKQPRGPLPVRPGIIARATTPLTRFWSGAAEAWASRRFCCFRELVYNERVGHSANPSQPSTQPQLVEEDNMVDARPTTTRDATL